jgi:hypothetical protein
VGQGGDRHCPGYGQRTHRGCRAGRRQDAASELGAAGQRGERLARPEAHAVERGTCLLEAGAAKASEQLLGAVDR